MSYGRGKYHVDRLLNHLDDVNRYVHGKKQTLNGFLQYLNIEMKRSGCSLLEQSHFIHIGSSYEGAVVHNRTDFGIPLILPFPADDFELVERYEPGIYKLRYRRPCRDDDDSSNGSNAESEGGCEFWLNWKDFLEIKHLKAYIYNELSQILDRLKLMYPGWSFCYKRQLRAVVVTLKHTDGEPIQIAIVPALGGLNFENIPGARHRSELPDPLQRIGQLSYYLALAPAPYFLGSNDSRLLATVVFAELEKACLRDSVAVQNAVRLVKFVSEKMNLKKQFSLMSFHIKRVAIKYFSSLDGMSDWSAYWNLLGYLSNELQAGGIDGYFLHGQNIYEADHNTARMLMLSIQTIRFTIKPHMLLNPRSFQE